MHPKLAKEKGGKGTVTKTKSVSKGFWEMTVMRLWIMPLTTVHICMKSRWYECLGGGGVTCINRDAFAQADGGAGVGATTTLS